MLQPARPTPGHQQEGGGRTKSECSIHQVATVPQSRRTGLPPQHHTTTDYLNKVLTMRVKDVEICVPIVHGTVAFHLGRKATRLQAHKWTVYIRSAKNEDLGAVIKKVVFRLHPSFDNPTRVVDSPPFELSECGWGEFRIAISLFFQHDVCENHLDLFHHLRLHPEDETPHSTKKPVVEEYYDEIIFRDPSELFLARVQNHPAVMVPQLPIGINLPCLRLFEGMNANGRGGTRDHLLSQWFMNFSDEEELLKIAAARQQVQEHIVNLRRQISTVGGLPGSTILQF